MKCNKGPIKCLGFNFETIWAECDKLDIEKKRYTQMWQTN